MKFPVKKFFLAVVTIFVSSTLIPVGTYQLFSSTFALEPEHFWRFTPATPVGSVPAGWILATLVANIIIAAFAVLAYYIFQNAIPGSWVKKALWFGIFAVILGVVIPVWSMYTLMNLAGVAAASLLLDGIFEYMLYTFIIAFIFRE